MNTSDELERLYGKDVTDQVIENAEIAAMFARCARPQLQFKDSEMTTKQSIFVGTLPILFGLVIYWCVSSL